MLYAPAPNFSTHNIVSFLTIVRVVKRKTEEHYSSERGRIFHRASQVLCSVVGEVRGVGM